MRLIDADALSKAFGDRVDVINENMRKGTTLPNIAWFSCMASAENIVEAQPTVDAVPVIRCKDCKWYYGDYCGGFGDGAFTPEYGFCHNAERKEE